MLRNDVMNTQTAAYQRISSFGRKMLRAFGVCFGILLVVVYALGWVELIRNGEVDPAKFHSILNTIPYSFRYFLGTLAYGWWFLVLIGSLILSFLIALFWEVTLALKDRFR